MEQSAPRVVEADRSQLELRPFDLDATIPHDHRARLLWRAVETLDLRAFYERIKSRVGTAGRPPGDPKVFVTLWLYATMDGVGSAREVEAKRRVEYTGGRKAKGEPRGSMTDPEARKMRMANGGFSPGYNAQFATDAQSGIIVGVRVTNNGSDSGQAPPMIAQIEQRTGHKPKASLVDAAYTDKASVDALAAMDVTLYGSVVERCGKDPFKPQMTDSPAVSALRKRMGSEASQAIYKERSHLSERVNADVRTYRTMDRRLVRGAGKALCIALWNALALNLMRWFVLAPTS